MINFKMALAMLAASAALLRAPSGKAPDAATPESRMVPARCWWAGFGRWSKAKHGQVYFLPPVPAGPVTPAAPTMCVANRETGDYQCWEMPSEPCKEE